MSSLFLLLSFIGIVLVALWSIEQERVAPEERGFGGLFGIKRPSTLPPPAVKPRTNGWRGAHRAAEPAQTRPDRLSDEDVAALFRKPPRTGG